MTGLQKILSFRCHPQGGGSKKETKYTYVDNTAKKREEERLKEQARLENERRQKELAEAARLARERQEAEERRQREGEAARRKVIQEEETRLRNEAEAERQRQEAIRQRELKIRERRDKLLDYKFGDKINLASFKGNLDFLITNDLAPCLVYFAHQCFIHTISLSPQHRMVSPLPSFSSSLYFQNSLLQMNSNRNVGNSVSNSKEIVKREKPPTGSFRSISFLKPSDPPVDVINILVEYPKTASPVVVLCWTLTGTSGVDSNYPVLPAQV